MFSHEYNALENTEKEEMTSVSLQMQNINYSNKEYIQIDTSSTQG